MDISQAKELLMLHAYISEDIYNHKMQNGFLGSLRPFTGLNEDNFHEVMYVMKVMEPLFNNSDTKIDKQIISAVWGICHLARTWGIHPDGMLRRNKLITNEEILKLETWLDHISYTFWGLLDGLQGDAFDEYLSEYGGFRQSEDLKEV